MQAKPEGYEKKGYPRRNWYTDVCNVTCRIMAPLWFALHLLLGKTFVPDTCVSGETIQHGAPPSLFNGGDVTKLEKMSHFQRPLREGGGHTFGLWTN